MAGMSRVGLSPAEMARAGTMSEAKRKRYMKNGGLVKRGVGGALGKSALRKEVKKGTEEFIKKGGKITKIKEAKPRADYTSGPIKRKKKSKGGEKKPFVRKTGGKVGKKEQGYKARKDESIAMRVKKKRTTKQLHASADESYGKFGKGKGKGKINRSGDSLVAASYD
jgi:hypothetical protein